MLKKLPYIVCLCPTYKRPACFTNALACFTSQNYPQENRQLLVADEIQQYTTGVRLSLNSEGIYFVPKEVLYKSKYHVSEKYKVMIEYSCRARPTENVIFVIWEDDDIYLNNHISNIVKHYQEGKAQFFSPETAYSTYGQNRQGCIIESARGRFHGAWAFTKSAYLASEGYTANQVLDFDMRLQRSLIEVAERVNTTPNIPAPSNPILPYNSPHKDELTYIYRWSNGYWHGSQAGDGEGYNKLNQELEQKEFNLISSLYPSYDNETKNLIKKLTNL